MNRGRTVAQDPIFSFKGTDYSELSLSKLPDGGAEALLIEIGGEREKIGLEVARLDKQLQERREFYKQVTEARNKLKAFLVPTNKPTNS